MSFIKRLVSIMEEIHFRKVELWVICFVYFTVLASKETLPERKEEYGKYVVKNKILICLAKRFYLLPKRFNH